MISSTIAKNDVQSHIGDALQITVTPKYVLEDYFK